MREVPAVFLSEGLLDLLPIELREEVRGAGRSVLSPTLATIVAKLALHERGWMPWSRAAVFRAAAQRIKPQLAAFALPPVPQWGRSGVMKLGALSLLLFAAACASTPRVTPPTPTGSCANCWHPTGSSTPPAPSSSPHITCPAV